MGLLPPVPGRTADALGRVGVIGAGPVGSDPGGLFTGAGRGVVAAGRTGAREAASRSEVVVTAVP